MARICLAIGFGLALVWGFGCGPAAKPGLAPAAPVKGTVNQDGKPLPTGEIHFLLEGFPPGVLPIKDGTFSGDAPIGKDKVEVYVYVDGPVSDKYRGEASKKNIVPSKYWGPNTTLEANVEAGGANDFKFDITSK